MATATTHNSWTFTRTMGQVGGTEFMMLVLACYILSFGTFENLASLGSPDRAVPENPSFDLIALIKTASRVVSAGLVGLGLARVAHGRRGRYVLGCLWPMLLFGLWAVASTPWSPMKAYTFGHALEFLLLLAVAALAALACDRPERIRALLSHACIIQFIYLAILVTLFLADPSSASILRRRLVTEQILIAGQEESTFVKNPAEIACIAGLAAILIVALRLLWGWGWTRRLWPILLAFAGGILFVTQSRAPLVTAFLLMGLTVMTWANRRIVAGALLLATLAATIWIAAQPGLDRETQALDRAATFLSRGQSSEELRGLGGRMSNWTGVLGTIREHPEAIIVGYGYSMATPTGKMWHENAWRRYTGHNILLDVFAGTGVIGTILFLFGFIRLFGLVRQGLASSDRRLPFLGLLVLLYALLSGIFGDSIVGPIHPSTVAVFMILGLSLWRIRLPEDGKAAP